MSATPLSPHLCSVSSPQPIQKHFNLTVQNLKLNAYYTLPPFIFGNKAREQIRYFFISMGWGSGLKLEGESPKTFRKYSYPKSVGNYFFSLMNRHI